MKFETYEKAVKLRARMDYLSILEGVFENACKNRYIAAIDDCKFLSSSQYVITDCKVINHQTLTDDIREKLIQVLREEYEVTRKEFEAL